MKKITEKIICLLFSVLLLFSGSAVYADKQIGDYTYNYFTYNINSDGSVTLISCDSSVTEVFIPDQINNMPVSAVNGSTFHGCEKLEKITVSQDNKYFSTDNAGVLMNKAQTRIIKCPQALKIYSYSLPDTADTISPYCFENSENLEFITIPKSVTSIGKEAFKGTSFENITLSNSSVKIGEEAFGYDKNGKIPAFNLYGYSGSTAEKYASENNIPFKCIDHETFNISVNGNLYFYSDSTSFSSPKISVTNKSDEPVGYSFSSTPSEIYKNNGSEPAKIDLLTIYGNVISSVNVRVAMAGDANADGRLNVRDAAFIASAMAKSQTFKGFEKMCTDKNKDGVTNIRDAAEIARELAGK